MAENFAKKCALFQKLQKTKNKKSLDQIFWIKALLDELV